LSPAAAKKGVLEAGTRYGWGVIVGPEALFITQDEWGHSAPAKVLAEELGYTNAKVADRVLRWIKE